MMVTCKHTTSFEAELLLVTYYVEPWGCCGRGELQEALEDSPSSHLECSLPANY